METIPAGLNSTIRHQILTIAEASQYLNVSEQTLATWRYLGRGKGPDWLALSPRVVRYTMASLNAFIDASATSSLTAA